MRGAGIYIHIPFCVQKCIYCDFNSIPGCSEELQSGYFDALKQEITDFQSALASRKSPFSPDGGALGSRKSPFFQNGGALTSRKSSFSQDGGALLSKSADSIGSFSADVDDAADKDDGDVSAFADTLFIGGGTPSSVVGFAFVNDHRESVYQFLVEKDIQLDQCGFFVSDKFII